jgi:hypothetical protein
MKHMNFPPVDGDKDISDNIKSMGRMMAFSADVMRYDLQRNLLQIVEHMQRTAPANLYHWAAFREVADMVIEQFDSREKLHSELARVAGKSTPDSNQLRRKSNILDFHAFKNMFNQRSGADKFMTDRMLAVRSEAGDLSLTAWGEYVLRHNLHIFLNHALYG